MEQRLVRLGFVAVLSTLFGCSGPDKTTPELGDSRSETTLSSESIRKSCLDVDQAELADCRSQVFVSEVVRLDSDALSEPVDELVADAASRS